MTKKPPEEPTLLRKRDVAKLLNVSESTVDLLRERGELRWLRVGGQIRFTTSDLAEYLSRCAA